MKSKNGCMKGGPMRPCIRATALRSTQRKNHAAGTAKSSPGKMSRRARAVVRVHGCTSSLFALRMSAACAGAIASGPTSGHHDGFDGQLFCRSLGQNLRGLGYAQNDGVGTRRAAGNKDIDRNVLVERPIERAAVDEDIGRGRAGADGHHGLGPADLAVDGLDGVHRVVGDRAGDAENVGVARAAFKAHAQLLGVVARREAGDQSQCRSRCNCPSSCERARGCGGGSSTSICSRASWSPSKQHLQRIRPDAARPAAAPPAQQSQPATGMVPFRMFIGDAGGFGIIAADPTRCGSKPARRRSAQRSTRG